MERPLSDGGEGLLDVLDALGGERIAVDVDGPLGRPVRCEFLLADGVAVVESARASGLALVGGPEGNDPVAASSRGTGQAVAAAVVALGEQQRARGADGGDRRARPTVVVGLGGSATTDGGWDAVRAIADAGGMGEVGLVGAWDVSTGFVDAAEGFAPQKGATPGQVLHLRRLLEAVAERYRTEFGIDVRELPGAGAAGGLGGGLAALGARLQSGYQVVADLTGLPTVLGASAVVVTGEGKVDDSSFTGKVVGSLVRDASALGAAVLVVAGTITPRAAALLAASGARSVSLVERFGPERALADTEACLEEAVTDALTDPPDRWADGGR